MSVITISREFGNVGDDIGERIAQALGYHFVDKEFVGPVLSQYGLINFDSESDPPAFGKDSMRSGVSTEIRW